MEGKRGETQKSLSSPQGREAALPWYHLASPTGRPAGLGECGTAHAREALMEPHARVRHSGSVTGTIGPAGPRKKLLHFGFWLRVSGFWLCLRGLCTCSVVPIPQPETRNQEPETGVSLLRLRSHVPPAVPCRISAAPALCNGTDRRTPLHPRLSQFSTIMSARRGIRLPHRWKYCKEPALAASNYARERGC
jgi:hypothetical protein